MTAAVTGDEPPCFLVSTDNCDEDAEPFCRNAYAHHLKRWHLCYYLSGEMTSSVVTAKKMHPPWLVDRRSFESLTNQKH